MTKTQALVLLGVLGLALMTLHQLSTPEITMYFFSKKPVGNLSFKEQMISIAPTFVGMFSKFIPAMGHPAVLIGGFVASIL